MISFTWEISLHKCKCKCTRSRLVGHLYPLNLIAIDPKVAVTSLCIDGWMNRKRIVLMYLDCPARIVASHEIQGDDIATATGALEPKPFSLRDCTDNDQTAVNQLIARVD